MPPIETIDLGGETAVRGHLHLAQTRNGDALVLTHGAGGNAHARLLVLLAEAFAAQGISVLRCDLPFRQKRPHGPPMGSAQQDQKGLKAAAIFLRERFRQDVFLGGQSYGGRQASMLAAAEPGVADGLLLLSYPLHPPNKPAQLRTAHFPKLQTPALFVSGTKDPFGTIAELDDARSLIPAKTQLIAVAAGGHSLVTKKNEAEVVATIVAGFQEFFSAAAPAR